MINGSGHRGMWRALVLVLLGMSIKACASTPDMIEPPPMTLEMGPVIPKVTHLNVKNGAGEVLFDGKPDDNGLASANPDRSKFDGTLVITSSWSDKVTDEIQTLRHEPGKPVKISLYPDIPRTFKVEIQEPPQAEQKKYGVMESLIPALVPSIGLGIGGRRDGEDRDRRIPR